MKRCLELAAQGWPKCRPNPMVGAVIVHEGEIIGEGYHRKYGEAHAEVNAIESVKDKSLLQHSTIYVSLEPCAHHGKTPPCSDLIIAANIPTVVIAVKDTFSEVQGRGIQKLKESGIEVIVGILENEASELNKRFFCFHEKTIPYTILKWAVSSDGFIDKAREDSSEKAEKITGSITQQLVHQWRAEEQSILVGGNTARLDNPQLNVRLLHGPNPLRIIVSAKCDIPDSSLLLIDGQPTIIYNSEINIEEDNVSKVAINFEENWIDELMQDLHSRDIQSVLIEGGANILQQFLDANIWDEIRELTSDKLLGSGIKAPKHQAEKHSEKLIGADKIIFYRNTMK